MRKFALLIVVFIVLTALCFSTAGCTDKKPAADSLAMDSTQIDTTVTDSLDNIISETPMPKAADELFDDFVFNFAANKKLQFKRIQFPLSVFNGNKETKLGKHQWKMENFFMRQGYYTLIFDNRKQMNLVKDTTIQHVVIEKVYLERKYVKQFVFNRIDGQWMMTSVINKALSENMNSSFLRFYQRFSVDSAYQVQSMNDLVEFTSPDPDDDFKMQTGSITPDQWPSFKPGLIPSGIIYNIIYGQKYTESNQKIFVIRGVANGMESEMVFRRQKNNWKLMKFNG